VIPVNGAGRSRARPGAAALPHRSRRSPSASASTTPARAQSR